MLTLPIKRRGELHNLLLDDSSEVYSKSKIYISKNGYAVLYKDKKSFYLHREIMGNPVGLVVDHVNGNKLDNRKNNLRVCTRGENATYCRGRSKTTQFKGITQSKYTSLWQARIFYRRRCISLGMYSTQKEAARAYDRAAVKYFGPFARTNAMLLKGF